MAHGNEIGCLFGPHNAGNLGDREDVPFRNLTALDFLESFRLEVHLGVGSRHSLALSFSSDIDHTSSAGFVEVCKLSHFPR